MGNFENQERIKITKLRKKLQTEMRSEIAHIFNRSK